jgi:hypothetical protein
MFVEGANSSQMGSGRNKLSHLQAGQRLFHDSLQLGAAALEGALFPGSRPPHNGSRPT